MLGKPPPSTTMSLLIAMLNMFEAHPMTMFFASIVLLKVSRVVIRFCLRTLFRFARLCNILGI